MKPSRRKGKQLRLKVKSQERFLSTIKEVSLTLLAPASSKAITLLYSLILLFNLLSNTGLPAGATHFRS
jgi:hypothetical protein